MRRPAPLALTACLLLVAGPAWCQTDDGSAPRTAEPAVQATPATAAAAGSTTTPLASQPNRAAPATSPTPVSPTPASTAPVSTAPVSTAPAMPVPGTASGQPAATATATDTTAPSPGRPPAATATPVPATPASPTVPTGSSAAPAARVAPVATGSPLPASPVPATSPRVSAPPAPATPDPTSPAAPDAARPGPASAAPADAAPPAARVMAPAPAAAPLNRGTSLMGAALPPAPQAGPADDGLPPLRQLLLQAPDMAVAEQQRRALSQWGLRILSRRALANLGWVLSTYKVPDDLDLQALQAEIAVQWPVEANQRYRLQASERRHYAQRLLGASAPSRCHQPVKLAMLDSAVNSELPELAGRVEVADATGLNSPPHEHGTGVAALMVGQGQVPGLLPQARLLAVNVFADDGAGGMETRTDWLLVGLDRVAAYRPAVLNMSFGGNYSGLLEQVVTRLAGRMALVAAAGNGGQPQLMYPAAYTGVQAVAATDDKLRLLALSNGGDQVFWRAPGQDLWTLDARGRGRYQTGTSFAAPLVSAALAAALEEGLSLSELPAFWPSGTPDLSELCGG